MIGYHGQTNSFSQVLLQYVPSVGQAAVTVAVVTSVRFCVVRRAEPKLAVALRMITPVNGVLGTLYDAQVLGAMVREL